MERGIPEVSQHFIVVSKYQLITSLNSQAKFFEEQMAALFSGAAGAGEAPTAEQFNLGFQKMAGSVFGKSIFSRINDCIYFLTEAAQLACQGDADTSNVDPNYVDHITQALKVVMIN